MASEPRREQAMALMQEEIETSGFHLIRGVTRPWFDFMLWADQDSTLYEVELTDGLQKVTVVMMGNFLVRGWAAYATFGRASTGGWATADALYCLRDDYDLESERFKVSYLQHEARHFADYGPFPKLEQTDLEYRAKLTQLVFAVETFHDLVRTFRRGAAPSSEAPHSYANWAVIQDPSLELFGEKVTVDDPRWETLDVNMARQAARRLLEENTAQLIDVGAATTRGVFMSSDR